MASEKTETTVETDAQRAAIDGFVAALNHLGEEGLRLWMDQRVGLRWNVRTADGEWVTRVERSSDATTRGTEWEAWR